MGDQVQPTGGREVVVMVAVPTLLYYLGTFLVVGFILHNVTEGIGIAAPLLPGTRDTGDAIPVNPSLGSFLVLLLVGSGLGTVFPVSTVCMQNAVSRAQMGVATGAANFFRALFSALVVALLGAIVLGGLGGVTGMSVEMLARTASAPELAYAFRFVFLACALVLSFGMAFLISMEERPLKGPTAPSQAVTAPTAPATPIPAE